MSNDYHDAPSWFYLMIGIAIIIGGTILGIASMIEMAGASEGTVAVGLIFLLAAWGFGGMFVITGNRVRDDESGGRRRR